MNPYIAAEPAQKIVVDLDLGDIVYKLEPSLAAMRAVNRIGGGLTGAFRLLSSFDFDAFVAVIAAGTNTTGPAVSDIERAVYAHGIEPLAQPLTRFVAVLMNGGRDPDAPKPGADADQD